MTGAHLLTLIAAVATALFVLELVRRRQIRDKYAVQFLVLAAGMVVLAFAPGLLEWIATTLSIIEPVNALFFLAILVLLASIVHLSWEISRLESETRTLSEEVALLRLEVEVHHEHESRDTE
ncbi:MAG: DUF2304 domain-containing protein [Nitriliruptoraceae bacterium]